MITADSPGQVAPRRAPRGYGAAHPARPAWLALALTPLTLLVGLAVAWLIADLLLLNPMADGGSSLRWWESLVVYVPAVLVWLLAPVAALRRGWRAYRAGSTSGFLVTVAAGAVVAAVILLAVRVLVP